MSGEGIVGKIVKPAAEILAHIGEKIPRALAAAHHRVGQMAHDAADHFDKAEEDLARDAERHHLQGGHHHEPGAAGGAGAAAAARAKEAETEASNAVKEAEETAERQAAETAREGAADPERTSKPAKDRCKGGDPVDLVSGEVLVEERDVELPGILSLVLRRTHLSSYRSGRWFGRSWASTLDERLEADGRGVVLATEDGMLLVYPIPRPDGPVYPSHGPRWPLEWDGTPNSEIRVTDPASGHTRHFTPPREPSAAPFVMELAAITDRNGNRVTIDRTTAGPPTAVRHNCGYTVAVEAETDRVTALRLVEPDGRLTGLRRFEYDARGDLIGVVNETGLAKRFEYDEHGRVVCWTDRVGSWYRFEYDDKHRCVSGTGADGFLDCTIAYDDSARTTSYTDSLGNTTIHRQNELLQRIAVTDPLGNTQYAEWDAFGRLLASMDALGRESRFSYDEKGNLVACTRPDVGTYHLQYNELRLPVSITDPGGDTWSYAFDPRGNRTEATDPTGAVTRYAYDDRGRLTAVTDALGNVTVVRTDDAGLPTAITDPLGNTTIIERDALGRVAAVTDPLGNVTRMGWTTEGCPAWREFADGSREEWEWDAEGNLLSHTDPAGNTSRHTSTHFARESSSTDPDGAALHFTYDTELRLTGVTNSEGRTWHYAYDAAGRLVGERDFDGRGLSYSYDAAGALTASTSDDGVVVELERDPLGRVVTQRFGPDDWTTFTYSSGGHVIGAANREVTLSREVDALGRILSEMVNGATTTYVYDPTGNLLRRRLPSGIESTWTYDAGGRPQRLSVGGHTMAFGHDSAGREVSRSLGDSLRLTQTWDEVDRLTSQAVERGGDAPGGPASLLRSYGYGTEGLPNRITDATAGTRHFGLDPKGRVTSVRSEGWTASYAYDATGNLAGAVTDDPATPPELRRRVNEYTGTVIHRSGRTTYSHDPRGRLIRRTVKLLNGQRKVQAFAWDEADRLRETVTPGGERWRYTYDGLGRRVAKSRVNNDGAVLEEIRYFWDGSRIAESTGTTGGAGWTWEYAPASPRPVIQVDRGTEGHRVYAVVTDLSGAPSELVTPEGEVAWRNTSDLWGTPGPETALEGADCPLRFPGQYADVESGLNYNVNRYYDPETARYTSPDPLGLAPSPNPVAYVDNPLTDSDPLGLAKRPYRDDATLLKHAKMIHDAVRIGKKPASADFAHSKMTVAVFADHHGNLYYTVNNNKTSLAQRQLAESLGYERINGKFYTSPMETDAEQIMLNAMDSGRIPDAGRLATSRPACDDVRPNGKPGQDCRDRIAKYPNVKLIE